MTDEKIIKLLKISIIIGVCLLLLGIYFHHFNDYIESLGVQGIIISAVCIAFGLVFSLPTKMYLTFLLVKRESESKQIASKYKEK
jgi:vacuolar-type H+-ATPase subunit I/STV1